MDTKTKDKQKVSPVIRSPFVAPIAFDCSEFHFQVASKAILAGVITQSLRTEFGLFSSFDQLSAFPEFPPASLPANHCFRCYAFGISCPLKHTEQIWVSHSITSSGALGCLRFSQGLLHFASRNVYTKYGFGLHPKMVSAVRFLVTHGFP